MDWANIIVAILAPLAAASIAFGLNRSENHRRSLRDLFYSLRQHVDAYQWAMYRMISHSRNHDIAVTSSTVAAPSAEQTNYAVSMWNRINEESREVTVETRLAISALNADKLQLKMLFKHSQSQPLVEAIGELVALATVFVPTQHGGRTPEYENVKDLPIDAQVVEVQKQMELFWVNTSASYPAAVDEL